MLICVEPSASVILHMATLKINTCLFTHKHSWVICLTHILSLITSASLPASTQRHRRRSCDSDGLHRVHWSRCHDGCTRPAGGCHRWFTDPRQWIALQHFSQPCIFFFFFFQDHDVQEEKILLVSLLMAEMGVHSVAYAFPQVQIITTAVDKEVNDLFHIIPGIGRFQLSK